MKITMARQITVQVGRNGGRVEKYALTLASPTIADALEAADITLTKGDKIRLNGDSAYEADDIKNGDIITIAGKVSGGSR